MAHEAYNFPLIIGNKKVELCSTKPKNVASVQQVTTENKGDDPKMISQLKFIQFLRENKNEYYFSNNENKLIKNKIRGKVSPTEQPKSNNTNDFIELIETTQQLLTNTLTVIF